MFHEKMQDWFHSRKHVYTLCKCWFKGEAMSDLYLGSWDGVYKIWCPFANELLASQEALDSLQQCREGGSWYCVSLMKIQTDSALNQHKSWALANSLLLFQIYGIYSINNLWPQVLKMLCWHFFFPSQPTWTWDTMIGVSLIWFISC